MQTYKMIVVVVLHIIEESAGVLWQKSGLSECPSNDSCNNNGQ